MNRVVSRHWIFLGLFVLVALAMGSGIRLDTPVSDRTAELYDFIESLPEGSVLLVSFDHEASSLPEIRPIGQALLRHAFRKNHRLIGMALLAEGTAIGYRLMQQAAAEYGKEYGKDYAYLGFKPQYIAAILSMGESIPATFPKDYLGRPYESLKALDGVATYADVAGVLSIADGSLTTHWMEYGRARYGVRVVSGVTAAMVTTYDPYLASGQMYAMMGGLRGAAEYEDLIARPGGGKRGMLAQTATHLYVIVLIGLGNLSYFLARRKKETS